MLRLSGKYIIALVAALSATPVLSQATNPGNLSLAPGFPKGSGVVTGETGGSYSLPSIANKDNAGNACLGYGYSSPSHVMVLQQNFANLNLALKSGGDTTIVVRGPNPQTVRCGDDTGSSKDASVQGPNWPAGTYEIWVGSIEAGQRLDYTLTVRE